MMFGAQTDEVSAGRIIARAHKAGVNFIESMQIAQKTKAHAQKRGMSVGDCAINWVLNTASVTSVLAGPCTPEQWEADLGALAHRFSAEDEALVDSLVVTGHPSTQGRTIRSIRSMGGCR